MYFERLFSNKYIKKNYNVLKLASQVMARVH